MSDLFGSFCLPTFCPVYQVIYLITDAGEKVVYGWEALMRGPENTQLEKPLNLFRRARNNGRLPEIDLLAFGMSCRCFVANDPGGILFVNLFPETIVAPEFDLNALFRFLREINLPPERLVIEILETPYDLISLKKAVWKLREAGIRYALDDFGAGHKDIERWLDLLPGYIKCDRSLIANVNKDRRRLRVLQILQELCQIDGTTILAEGVANELEYKSLHNHTKIRLMQGFVFGQPKTLGPEVWPEKPQALQLPESSGVLASFRT